MTLSGPISSGGRASRDPAPAVRGLEQGIVVGPGPEGRGLLVRAGGKLVEADGDSSIAPGTRLVLLEVEGAQRPLARTPDQAARALRLDPRLLEALFEIGEAWSGLDEDSGGRMPPQAREIAALARQWARELGAGKVDEAVRLLDRAFRAAASLPRESLPAPVRTALDEGRPPFLWAPAAGRSAHPATLSALELGPETAPGRYRAQLGGKPVALDGPAGLAAGPRGLWQSFAVGGGSVLVPHEVPETEGELLDVPVVAGRAGVDAVLSGALAAEPGALAEELDALSDALVRVGRLLAERATERGNARTAPGADAERPFAPPSPSRSATPVSDASVPLPPGPSTSTAARTASAAGIESTLPDLAPTIARGGPGPSPAAVGRTTPSEPSAPDALPPAQSAPPPSSAAGRRDEPAMGGERIALSTALRTALAWSLSGRSSETAPAPAASVLEAAMNVADLSAALEELLGEVAQNPSAAPAVAAWIAARAGSERPILPTDLGLESPAAPAEASESAGRLQRLVGTLLAPPAPPQAEAPAAPAPAPHTMPPPPVAPAPEPGQPRAASESAWTPSSLAEALVADLCRAGTRPEARETAMLRRTASALLGQGLESAVDGGGLPQPWLMPQGRRLEPGGLRVIDRRRSPKAGEEGSYAVSIAMTPPTLGPVQARLELRQQRLSVYFQADREETADAIRAGLPALRARLAQAGLLPDHVTSRPRRARAEAARAPVPSGWTLDLRA